MDPSLVHRGGPAGIGRKAIEGTGWLFLVHSAERIATFVVTVVLARLLTPEEFGLVAIAWIVVNTSVLFADLGIGQAIIRSREDKERLATSAFLLSAGGGVALYAAAFGLAPLVARIFGRPEVVGLVRVLGLLLIIVGVQRLPTAFLDRKLQFRTRVLPELLSAGVFIVAAIALALLGAGYWSLVVGRLCGSALATVLYWLLEPVPLNFRSGFLALRELSGYGKHIFGFSVARFVFSNADGVVIGKVLGAATLGLYNNAMALAQLLSTQIHQLVGRVMFPAYVRLDQEPSQKAAFLQNVKTIGVLAIPFSMSLIVFAPGLIRIVYGPRWLPAAPALRVLGLYGLLRSLLSIITPLLMARNRQRAMMIAGLLQALMVVVLAAAVVRRGQTIGIAWLFTAVEGCGLIGLAAIAAADLKVRWSGLLRSLAPAAVSGFAAFAGVGWIAGRLVRATPAPTAFVVACLLASLCLYAVLLIGLDRDVRSILRFLGARSGLGARIGRGLGGGR